MEPAVRAARPQDLPSYVALLEEAARRLWKRDVRQWKPGSQRARMAWLESLVAQGALLRVDDAQGPLGGAILTRAATPEWAGVPGDAFFAHGLVVATRAEGRGLGARLLARLAELARREGAELLRLDCVEENARLRAFYRDLGFRERERVQVEGVTLRRFEQRLAAGPLRAPALPLAEPVPRIPPPPRRTARPLPPYRHLPGRTPHPVRSPAGHARGAAEPVLADLEPARLHASGLFRYGADLFDAAYWWEAHEAWEAIWAARGRWGPEARAMQGLIWLAAACLKRFLGSPAVAERLAERGLAALGPRPAGLPTLDVRTLAEQVRLFVAREDARPPCIPLGDDAGPARPPRADGAECR